MSDDKQSFTPPVPDAPEPSGSAHEPPGSAAGRPRDRRSLRVRLAGAVTAVALVGLGGGYALAKATDDNTAANAGEGRLAGSGDGFGGPKDGFGARGGPVAGEVYVTGTIASVGEDTVTVTTGDGTDQTYEVTSDTQIVQDGQVVALGDLDEGVDVLVHVLPGDTADGTAERVLAGSSASDFGGRGHHDDRLGEDAGETDSSTT